MMKKFTYWFLTALVISTLLGASAHARPLFWYRDGAWSTEPAFGHKHWRGTRSDLAKNSQVPNASKGPLVIVISIADQRISLYDNGVLIARSSVSTGVRDHPTPLGVFSVIGKQKWHRSNIYSDAPMPYMQRITWSGIALHAGNLPGYPASHGCIRLSNDFAIRLFHLTRRGTRVIIAHDDIRPVEINNPRLFVAKPKVAIGSPETGSATRAAETHAPLVSNAQAQGDAKGLDLAAAGVTPQTVAPISIFVSRKLSKLFVRQGFTPLFDVPADIQNPNEPMGTHVFSAMEFPNEGAAIRWTVVSIPEQPSLRQKTSAKLQKGPAKQRAVLSTPAQANAALDRIDIPQDAVERIDKLLTPGSSLIISDYGISDETGDDTDFIVLTH